MTRRRLATCRRATRVAFVDFVQRVIGVDLTDGQRVLCSVAFDGVDPVDLDPGDREIARQLFGDVERIPDTARHVLVAVCGARSGKTYLLIALRALHLALTCDLSSLADGELAYAVIIARDLRLARQALRYAIGAARKIGKSTVANETRNGFDVVRPDGAVVRFEVLPASHGGAAGRGRSLVFAGMDEAAFFRDKSTGVINDEDSYRGLSPRVLKDGQCVIASTPWAKGVGLVWDFREREYGNPQTVIVAHAPTSALRDDDHTRALMARERARDPENFAREFGAEFLDGGSSQWFDGTAIKLCTTERPRVLAPQGDALISVGVDLGFRTDASACVVLHHVDGVVRVAESLEIRPEPGKPLAPSQVVAAFAEVAKRHGASVFVADYVYIESFAELARGHGLDVVPLPGGARGKVDTYVQARALLAEGGVDVSSEDKTLLRQLREVTGTPRAGGGWTIASPRARGAHGDLVSAFVAATWYAEESRKWHEDRRRASVGVRVFSAEATIDLTADDDDDPSDDEIRERFYSGKPYPGALGGQVDDPEDDPVPDGWELVTFDDEGEAAE